MAKENKKSLIIWAAVALVVGVILGLLITNITTTGQAKSALGLNSGRQESDIQEDRRDLVLNLLRVNRIENRGDNQLQLNSTNGILMNSQNTIGAESDTALKLNAGNSGIAMYSQESTNGANINISSKKVNIFSNGGKTEIKSYLQTNNYSESSISLNPGTVENQTSETGVYGDEVSINFGLLSLVNRYHADVPVLEINGGPNWQDVTVNAPLKYNVAMDVNYGANNYYACIAVDGTIFKSYNPCN